MVTEEAFTQRVRDFLAAYTRRKDEHGDEDESLQGDGVAITKALQRTLVDAGLAGLTYPAEYGGQGLPRAYQEIFTRESSAFTLPTYAITISHGMCLPILNDFGTDDQKARHLHKIIGAEEIWCQMFSEPGAGSD